MLIQSDLRKSWPRIAVGFIALLVIVESAGLKFLLADYIYQLEGLHWALRDHFITKTLLHDGVRWINIVAVTFTLLLCLYHLSPLGNRAQLRRHFLLFTSVVLSFGLVNYFKAILGMDCPWDLQMYGGTKPYISFWSASNPHYALGRCFPAGHSSIGFAWMALFFFWRNNHPRLANFALIGSLVLGFALGFVQQLRGAHFFIDDITTAFVCWSVSAFIYLLGTEHETIQG
ncbi:phosphatase PAP2 family protein [Pseudidiomarina aquimaris]|uniref:phosphatase PAP2 family protein n=1 Tax=Pseudidiomarina aquimaris TaxID=641841 RepID=UPI003A98456D